MYSGKIKNKEYFIFESEEEFEHHFELRNLPVPELVRDWKDGQEGDWVVSDDGNIIQIIRRGELNHPSNRKNYRYYHGYVRTVVGSFVISRKSTMDTDFSQHPNRYLFSKKIKNTAKLVKERTRITKNERLFAADVVIGRGAIKAAMDAYGITDLGKARQKALILLKQERIVEEIKKGVSDILKQHGIDDEYIILGFKRLFENGEDPGVSFRALKELGLLTGTVKPKSPLGSAKQLMDGAIGIFGGFDKKAKLPDLDRPENIEIETTEE